MGNISDKKKQQQRTSIQIFEQSRKCEFGFTSSWQRRDEMLEDGYDAVGYRLVQMARDPLIASTQHSLAKSSE